ncbi:hydrolase [Rhodopirellula sp. MGV]|nr:hydrolase [Rhodopirellula sp. MGV]PNY36687.1 hydrolase [Rhodopirellula baltica]
MKSLLTFAAVILLIAAPMPSRASDETDRQVQPDVPQGKVTDGVFTDTELFPGTTRQYSVYVPAQYDPAKPASLMVFMDGRNYANTKGSFRVPTVFDNLIHQGAMPTTIAVFVNPGTIKATRQDASDRSNRSFEYDSMDDRYSRFLIDEFLPHALKGLNVSADPSDRAVGGSSSGGICAFTVAWHRPDQFGKVLSQIGSYTNIRGGWAYPGLVRQTQRAPKSIKVYLQDGVDDLSNLHGSWPLGNRDLAAALQFAGYTYKLEMTEGGHSGRWAGEVFPSALRWLWDDAAVSDSVPSTESKPPWQPPAEGIAKDDVPKGTVEQMEPFESKVFAGTTREWSVYVPAQYDKDTPAALMVFQDGERMRDINGRWRIPTVFDNLIASGDMPPTIAVFINPGHEKSRPRRRNQSSNRGYEYDSLGDKYSRFLLEEILPVVEAKYNVSADPEMRAIGGSSSGAICAFTVAWNRPDQFRKVFSSVGSFTNLRGGNVYPALVRKTEPKPIRVYMADTSGDVDNAFGSWPWANQRMASALKYMGYDVRFDWAEGYAHNADFGSAHFPEAMKWLWRTETHPSVVDTSDDLRGDMTLLRLLIPGEGWEVVASDLGFADAPCADAEGNFYYSDMRAPAVYRVDAKDGTQTTIAKESVSGLMFGPDRLLYGCQGSQQRVISIRPDDGAVTLVAEGVRPNDLAIASDGMIYITQTGAKQVTRIDHKTGETTTVDEGINKPNGIALSADGGTLAVSDYGGTHTWTFRVNPDHSLDAKMPTMPMRSPIDPQGDFAFNQPPPYLESSKGDGMAIDKVGRYYVTSALGVQVFDPTGRPCGLLPTPNPLKPLTSCVLAGAGHQYLVVTNGDTIYRRKVNANVDLP